jgi:hypothetical protein
LIVDRHTETVSQVESATKALFWLGERKRLLTCGMAATSWRRRIVPRLSL